jgi:Ca2+-binding RTX toxin-like protein
MGTINLSAGNLTLDTGLRVQDGAKIVVDTGGNYGGDIIIDTGNPIFIDAPGVIIASPNDSPGTGNDGGNISIDTRNPILIVDPGGIILDPPKDSPGTGNDMPGGTISINAEAIIIRRNIPGTARNDRLVGTPNDDVIIGLAGNDTLFGAANDDSLFGGLGNDLLYGGLGDDDLFGGIGNGNDTLFGLAGEDDLFGGLGNDILNGGFGDDDLFGETGNDRLVGEAGNDDLIGGAGNDLLAGGTGNDELFSGVGRDTLFGGAGRDEFIFSRTSGRDRIQDFVPIQDEILLNRLSFGLRSVVGSGFSVASEFAIVNTNIDAGNSVAKIVYNRVSGALFYNANGSLGGLGQTGELLAILTGAPSLNRGNFEIIGSLADEVFD